jgi:hypothetical protein
MKARATTIATMLTVSLLISAVVGVLTAVPYVHAAPKAVILSPLEFIEPMAYVGQMKSLLTSAGFTVEFLVNEQVSVDFFKTQLSNYKIIILRTEAYEWAHITYWYLGEFTTYQSVAKYAADIAAKRLNFDSFKAGFALQFVKDYYKSNPLPGSFVFLVASNSLLLASTFKSVGAAVVAGYYRPLNFGFGLVDHLTQLVIYFMERQGLTVKDGIYAVVNIFMQRAYRVPSETNLIPPLSYIGNGAVTLDSLAA